jgi:VIT1/CCC1 family predicted Fe2+/Mn2+ transporter
VGLQARGHRKAGRAERRHLRADIAAVTVGIAFPAVFFILAAAGLFDDDTAFTVAKWSGLGLIGAYGFGGARVSGASLRVSLLQGCAVALIGALLIALKALVH